MPTPASHLGPPPAKGHLSVARLSRYWYVACESKELGRRPLARTVLGIPLVLFRGPGGKPAALLDRCPHRNAPLSLGRMNGVGKLECAYHGWQFDADGCCAHVPGLLGDAAHRDRRVEAFATREQQGLVWVFAEPDVEPAGEPFSLELDAPGYATVVRKVEARATLHATLENALDVPHTAFLHRGLFRGVERHSIEAVVRRTANSVEVEYRGEPRPEGVVGRILSPSGGVVEHFDRFFLPSVAQVEYRLGSENHFVVTALATPVEDFHTVLYAVARFKTRFPPRIVRRVLEPFALRIFRQDARILERQARNIQRFGGEQFISTEIDLMGAQIWRLLRKAARAEGAGEDPESPEPGRSGAGDEDEGRAPDGKERVVHFEA